MKLTGNYFQVPNAIFDIGLDAQTIAIYAFLFRASNNSGIVAGKSVRQIAKKIGVSKNTAANRLDLLEQRGLIKVTTHFNQEMQQYEKNSYQVFLPENVVQEMNQGSSNNGIGVVQELGNSKNLNHKNLNNKKEKRYMITTNHVPFFSFYANTYQEFLKKNHPTVTEEQLNQLDAALLTVKAELDIEDEELKELAIHHFENLPAKNNGSIFAFLHTGVLFRYIEEIEYAENDVLLFQEKKQQPEKRQKKMGKEKPKTAADTIREAREKNAVNKEKQQATQVMEDKLDTELSELLSKMETTKKEEPATIEKVIAYEPHNCKLCGGRAFYKNDRGIVKTCFHRKKVKVSSEMAQQIEMDGGILQDFEGGCIICGGMGARLSSNGKVVICDHTDPQNMEKDTSSVNQNLIPPAEKEHTFAELFFQDEEQVMKKKIQTIQSIMQQVERVKDLTPANREFMIVNAIKNRLQISQEKAKVEYDSFRVSQSL